MFVIELLPFAMVTDRIELCSQISIGNNALPDNKNKSVRNCLISPIAFLKL